MAFPASRVPSIPALDWRRWRSRSTTKSRQNHPRAPCLDPGSFGGLPARGAAAQGSNWQAPDLRGGVTVGTSIPGTTRGPVIRCFVVAGLLVVPALGCGSYWSRVGSEDVHKTPEEAVADVFNPTSAYQLLGRLSAPEPLPFVGDVVFADGPADSVIAVVALALENRALTFQRQGDSFIARYRVDIQLQQEGETPIRVSREEAVRVPTYDETLRNEDSVLFQQGFHLLSGAYTITVDVLDQASPATSRAQGIYRVPTFTAGTTSDPLLVYRVTGRTSPREPLSMLLNPRGAVTSAM